VRAASEDLIAAKDLTDDPAITRLVTYLNSALDGGSQLRAYFDDWKRIMSNPVSDQVATGVKYLPDPAFP
jgi:hypothetical protein